MGLNLIADTVFVKERRFHYISSGVRDGKNFKIALCRIQFNIHSCRDVRSDSVNYFLVEIVSVLHVIKVGEDERNASIVFIRVFTKLGHENIIDFLRVKFRASGSHYIKRRSKQRMHCFITIIRIVLEEFKLA